MWDEFPEPRWVTAHAERGGSAVGPLALVRHDPTQEAGMLPPVTTRHFGARALRVEGARHRAISYQETWTTPENCVYTLVLPFRYVAAELTVEREGHRYQPSVDVAVTPEGRIFHYVVLMGERGTLRVLARANCDEEQHRRVVESAETVAATRKYADLRKRLREGALSSEFWFKLLSLGSKLLGGA